MIKCITGALFQLVVFHLQPRNGVAFTNFLEDIIGKEKVPVYSEKLNLT